MSDRDVASLAAAVADGEEVDWRAAEARLSSVGNDRLVASLRSVSEFGRNGTPQTVRATGHRLSAPLESIHALALACTALGLIGELIALERTGATRLLLIVGTLLAFAGAALFLDTARDHRARTLAACYWTVAAAFAASGLLWASRTWPGIAGLPLLAALRPEAFFAACLWQFAREFPAVSRFGPADRVCAFAFRVAMAAGCLLFAANLLPAVMPSGLDAAWPVSFQRINGYARWFFNILFGAALPALVAIAWRARSATGEESARVRVFLYALVAAFVPVLALNVAEGLSPAFERRMLTPAGQWWGAWAVYPPMFAIPAVTAYAVGVQRVLDVRMTILLGARYLVARWILMWGGTIPLLVLIRHLYRHADLPLGQAVALSPAPALMWTSGAAVALLLGRNRLVRVLDRWALAGGEEPSEVLAEMAARMKHNAHRSRSPCCWHVMPSEACRRPRAPTWYGGARSLTPAAPSLLPVMNH